MAWENFRLEQQRLQLIAAYIAGDATMTDLCIRYGISRTTGYKWYDRFIEEGVLGLKDQSKAPHNPNYIYSEELIQLAIDFKLKHLNFGPKKILVILQKAYPNKDWPSPTRMYEIFKENNLVKKKRNKSKVLAITSPLGALTNCNDTWSVDFKGWFVTGDRRQCEPLTIMDNVTRYLIRCTHVKSRSVDYVWPIFDEAFREYGLPNRMRSDNGTPFGSIGIGRLTRLSVKLIKAGVTPEWIRPGHPEENGRHERFHLTLKQDVATPPRKTLPLQIQAMQTFQDEYNFLRPHEALEMNTPGSCYLKSTRAWDGRFRAPEYDAKMMETRKVQAGGSITIKGKNHFIGEVLTGEYIGLKLVNEDESEMYYGPIYLGKLTRFGVEKPKIETRKKREKML